MVMMTSGNFFFVLFWIMDQIATNYLLPDLAGAKLTPKLHGRVAEAFVSKYGEYAGWAQTLLFIAELPAQKTLLQSFSQPINKLDESAEVNETSCDTLKP
jgi:N-glycosylase/DNA lyase